MKEKKTHTGKLWMVILCTLLFVLVFGMSCSAETSSLLLTGTEDYDMAYAAFEAANAQRVQNGKSALVMNQKLQQSAMVRARELAILFSHTRPNNSSCSTVITVTNTARGENIAYGQTTAASAVAAWMGSSDHKANILDSRWKQTGVGCFYHNGTYYWTQLFIDTAGTENYKRTGQTPSTGILEVDRTCLNLWMSRADSIPSSFCSRSAVTADTYEMLEVVPIHTNNVNRVTVLWGSDFGIRSAFVNSAGQYETDYFQEFERGQTIKLKIKKPGQATFDLVNMGVSTVGINLNFSHTHLAGPAATCTEPQKCTVCGEVMTGALGHAAYGTGCTSAIKCRRCNIELSGVTGHTPGPAATCTEPQRCTKCNTVLREQLYHTYPPRNCLTEQRCTRCGYLARKAYSQHYWSAQTTCYKAATASSAAIYKRECLLCDEYQLIPSGGNVASGGTASGSNAASGGTASSGLAKSFTLQKGKKLQLIVKTTKKVTYSSSKKKVATVSRSGLITAKSYGKATITVKYGKKSYKIKVTVSRPKVESIKNVPAQKTLKKGKKLTLKPKLYPAGSKEKLTFVSSNKKIATVNKNGKITAKKKGTVTITVKAGKVRAKCKLTVK